MLTHSLMLLNNTTPLPAAAMLVPRACTANYPRVNLFPNRSSCSAIVAAIVVVASSWAAFIFICKHVNWRLCCVPYPQRLLLRALLPQRGGGGGSCNSINITQIPYTSLWQSKVLPNRLTIDWRLLWMGERGVSCDAPKWLNSSSIVYIWEAACVCHYTPN